MLRLAVVLSICFVCVIARAEDAKKPENEPTLMKVEETGITRPSLIAAAGYSNRPLDNLASAYTLELGLMATSRLGATVSLTALTDSDTSASIDTEWFETELAASLRYQLSGPFKTNGFFVSPNIAWLKWSGSTSTSEVSGLRVGLDGGYHVGIKHGKLYADFGAGVGYYINAPEIHFRNKSIVWDSPVLISIFAKIGVAL